MHVIKNILSTPTLMFAALIAVSAASLIAALIGQYAFDLDPCILCLYQRGPFVTAILIGIIGLSLRHKLEKPEWLVLIGGFNFLTNAGIASYHTGVERHWWRSIFEGCKVPDLGNNPDNILANILSAPTARCDEIPWADPLLGLSMANYNVILCGGLFAACLISFTLIKKKS